MAAFQLSKADAKRRDELAAELRAKFGQLEDEISEYNSKLADLRAPLQDALDGYNEAVETARGFCEDIANEVQGQFDDKSEKWQGGDRGQAVTEWINEWEGIDLGEIDLDFPEDIEVPDISHADDLDALSIEPEGS